MGSSGTDSENGTTLLIETCQWTKAERFQEKHTSSGWQLINEANGLAVTNSGTSLYLSTPSGSASQYFT